MPRRYPALAALGEALWYVGQAAMRPKTRDECVGQPRPCPWVSCRYHALVRVNGAGTLNVPGMARLPASIPDIGWTTVAALAVSQSRDSCVLDIADRGPRSIAQIADVFGLNRERIRNTYARAMRKVRDALARDGIDAEAFFEVFAPETQRETTWDELEHDPDVEDET